MLPSLRLRLVAAFVSVIVVTLVFASVGSVVLLRQQQTEFARQRFGRLVDPFALRVQQMEAAGVPLTRMRAELIEVAQYYEIRILLLDSSARVVADTDNEQNLVGVTLNVSEAPQQPSEESSTATSSAMPPASACRGRSCSQAAVTSLEGTATTRRRPESIEPKPPWPGAAGLATKR